MIGRDHHYGGFYNNPQWINGGTVKWYARYIRINSAKTGSAFTATLKPLDGEVLSAYNYDGVGNKYGFGTNGNRGGGWGFVVLLNSAANSANMIVKNSRGQVLQYGVAPGQGLILTLDPTSTTEWGDWKAQKFTVTEGAA